MKRSTAVPAAFVSAVAATITVGCGPRVSQTRYCTDSQGRIIDDTYCSNPSYYGRPGYAGFGLINAGRPSWNYGGTPVQGFLRGGSPTPADGARITTPGGRVIRSGFGGSGRSFGGFGG